MSALEELKRLIADQVEQPHRDRALQLLDTVVKEERCLRVAGEIVDVPGHSGRSLSNQFSVPPNGDLSATPFATNGLVSGNGVLSPWPPLSPGASAWGNAGLAAGLSDLALGPGMSTGGSWPGTGFSATSHSWGFGTTGGCIESEEAAVLTGLALDAPAPVVGPWDASPILSLVDSAAETSRLESFLLPPAAANTPDAAQAESTEIDAESHQCANAKYSPVVSGNRDGASGVNEAASSTKEEEPSKRGAGETQHRRDEQPPGRQEGSKRHDPPRAVQSGKAETKRQDGKRIDAAGGAGGKAAAPAKVKLRGLPYGATLADVVTFFRGYGVTEGSVTFGVNSDGRPSGEAWVAFGRAEEARRAVRDKDRHHMGDRYVELFLLNEGGGVAGRGFR